MWILYKTRTINQSQKMHMYVLSQLLPVTSKKKNCRFEAYLQNLQFEGRNFYRKILYDWSYLVSPKFYLDTKQGKTQEIAVLDLFNGRCDQVKPSGFRSQEKPPGPGNWMSLPISFHLLQWEYIYLKISNLYIHIYTYIQHWQSAYCITNLRH